MSNKNKNQGAKISVDLASVDSVLDHISVKFRDVKNKEAVTNLQQLCHKLDRKHVNRNTLNLILKERLRILNGTAIVYSDTDQEELFDITMDEVTIIESILSL